MSIRWRLTIWYVLIIAIFFGSLSTFVYLALRHSIEMEHVAYDLRLARTMAELLRDQESGASEESEWSNGVDLSDEALLRQLRGHNAFLQLVDRSGRRSNGAAPPFVLTKIKALNRPQHWINRKPNYYMVVINEPITHGGRWVGSVQIFENLSGLAEFLERVRFLILVSMGLGVVIALAGGGFLAALAFRPVENLVNSLSSIGPEDLTKRLEEAIVPLELQPLVVSFNGMLDRLQISFSRQRQFVADASHELRTPVAAILGHAALLDRWGKSDPKVLDESVNYIRRDARRMEDLVESLLALAKSDALELPAPTFVNLMYTVEEVVTEARILAGKRSIEVSGLDEVVVMANDEAIRRIVSELVQNAIKYTSNMGCIRVEVGVRESYGFVTVADDGIGIGQGELSHIFERFYRVDKARSRVSHGTGLGLSIVQSLAEVYGGSVTVRSEPGKGSSFMVKLPLSNKKGPQIENEVD